MSEPATNFEANRVYLISLRERLGMTQALMATRLGMSLRAYSDLETGNAKCRLIHVMAAERLTLQEAKLRLDPDRLAVPVRQEINALALNLG